MLGLASPGMSIPNTGPSSASAAGMREVAAEAGVSLRLVQYYFGTKEELLLSGMQHMAAQFGERALTRIKRIKETGGQARPRDIIAAILGTCWPRRDVHEPGPEEVYVVAGTGVTQPGQRYGSEVASVTSSRSSVRVNSRVFPALA